MNELNIIRRRIKEQRERLGYSYQNLADLTHLSKSTLQRYETGNIGNLPLDKLEVLATALNCSPAYLMGWEEEKPNLSRFGVESLPQMRKIPLLGTIACGTPILARENIAQFTDVPVEIHADFALRCKGDSMVDAHIYDGSIVYVREQPDVENGEIAAVVIGEEATLKRVYKYPGKVVLKPENPEYAPLIYAGGEINDLRIIGRAIAHTSLVK